MSIACEKKEKKLRYNEVTWYKQRKKWRVRLYFKEEKLKFGGNFKHELDAGKKVNQLCEESGIPSHNPAISAMPYQQYLVTEKYFLTRHYENIRTVKIYF